MITRLIDPESPAAMRADQAESGNPVFDTFDDRLAVALDLGEKLSPSVTTSPRSRTQAWSTRG